MNERWCQRKDFLQREKRDEEHANDMHVARAEIRVATSILRILFLAQPSLESSYNTMSCRTAVLRDIFPTVHTDMSPSDRIYLLGAREAQQRKPCFFFSPSNEVCTAADPLFSRYCKSKSAALPGNLLLVCTIIVFVRPACSEQRSLASVHWLCQSLFGSTNRK